MTDPERTIAAQATAAGQGAIAVIRMSGPGCMDILKQCTPAAFTERLRPRRATLVCIRDAEGAAIDQALVTWFPAPASYTGEDTAEISCHGGMLVTDRLLKRLYQCGASPAEPGEFTKRAFLNGRMDLTQAEAVMDVISAGSDLALKAAQTQLDGGIGAQVDELKDNLVHVLAHIEAYIDFPDEDISPDTASDLLARLRSMEEKLAALLKTAEGGRLLREGIRTAIAGPPNVGKSSLINALCRNGKLAKTSASPGKTRLCNFFLLNDSFYLVDLPGYGFAKAPKEEQVKWGEMMDRYLSCGRVDHLFMLLDIRHEPTEDDRRMLQYLLYYNIPYTLIATKADKIARSKRKQQAVQNARLVGASPYAIPFSGETGEGREEDGGAGRERGLGAGNGV